MVSVELYVKMVSVELYADRSQFSQPLFYSNKLEFPSTLL